uniref:Contryphan Li981 n=1 Tax=Conus lividus TaxID=89426 RepID=COW81_CONLI|nr:RecName: Full=Contryphan Li981 [Conus lividus]
GCEWDSWC